MTGTREAVKITSGELMEAARYHLRCTLGRTYGSSNTRHKFLAVAHAARDLMVEQMLRTIERYENADAKRLYYISMEFLLGRALGNALRNLGILEAAIEMIGELDEDPEELAEVERDPALGNGGLGRLAACFLDSLATLGMPGFGYGIRYEFGLFRQSIAGGVQVEHPDRWYAEETPWLVERPFQWTPVPLYGRLEYETDRDGNQIPVWGGWETLIGVPYDMPVPGYGGNTVNFLRLFAARAPNDFDITCFNSGDYVQAVQEKVMFESVTKVLYPSDSVERGRELRLVQEYFLVACTLRDVVRHFEARHRDFTELPSHAAIQMNDTHPALAVAELMRILLDEKDVPWEKAWDITRATCAFTNHTLLPEALEKWPVPLMEKVLPRHLKIIYDINSRFLGDVSRLWPGDDGRVAHMSLIEEGATRQVRMAHLATVGAHSVNGVSELHTQLLRTTVMPDFNEMFPDRFNNKTNGVTQRRFLLLCNPDLSGLVTSAIGDGWITRFEEIRGIEPLAADPEFRARFAATKRANKERLAALVRDTASVELDPASLFDVQVKRIHEYKRQVLAVMHIICRYLALVEDGVVPAAPRSFLFGGKAAPGYWAAKQIIRLINAVAEVVNTDPRARQWMRVAFIPDYRVSVAERIFPGSDLSEQISTAGMEASGTGNMKFAINGALTICTHDGANIEMMEHIGAENMFAFGNTAEDLQSLRATYNPHDICARAPLVARMMDTFSNNRWSPREPGLFQWVHDGVMTQGDRYFLLADIESYLEAQARVDALYAAPGEWAAKAVLNVARMGFFSSDRTIRQYADEIWGIRGSV